MKRYDVVMVKRHQPVRAVVGSVGSPGHEQEITIGEAHVWPSGTIQVELYAFPNDGKFFLKEKP